MSSCFDLHCPTHSRRSFQEQQQLHLFTFKSSSSRSYHDGSKGGSHQSSDLKINWLKSFLINNNSWYHIPRQIFKNLGGIEFVLKYDFTIQRLTIKLSPFYQQVILYWRHCFDLYFCLFLHAPDPVGLMRRS